MWFYVFQCVAGLQLKTVLAVFSAGVVSRQGVSACEKLGVPLRIQFLCANINSRLQKNIHNATLGRTRPGGRGS